MPALLDNLIDAAAMAAEYPETFERPSDTELASLFVGDCVKVCRNDERFWILLTKVTPRLLEGTVNNNLVYAKNQDLPYGTPVRVKRLHVYQIHVFAKRPS